MTKLKPNQFILDGNLIQEYPLLFQTEMVDATLDERKTQTRREKGLEMRNDNPNSWTREGAKDIKLSAYFDINGEKQLLHYANAFQFIPKSPSEEKEYYTRPHYGKPGDLLWVRENWCKIESRIFYKADDIDTELINIYELDKVRWKPSIHLSKERSRIWLMIEDIYPERLQDISEEDAKAEGIEVIEVKGIPYCVVPFKDYMNHKNYFQRADYSFQSLWISINSQESWDKNPWIWVIKYRVLSKTGRPSDEIILENHLGITGKEVTNG